METIKLFVLFFLFSTIAVCQEYTPIVENGIKFSIAIFSGGNPNPSNSYYEIIGEDTTINEIIYQKLYATEMNVEFAPSMTLFGFIRETEERQVFLRDIDGEEGLYYDFYVEMGDTINFYNPFISELYQSIFPELDSDTLAIVDTVYYSEINGVNRKIYEVSAYGDYGLSPLQFIEGIGAVTGIKYCGAVNFFGLVGGYEMILCAYHDDELFYQNETYNTCFITNIQNDCSNVFEIFPNPASSHISLQFKEPKQGHLIIYNMQGIMVSQVNLELSQQHLIDISHLSEGNYMLEFIDSNKYIQRKLFVVI